MKTRFLLAATFFVAAVSTFALPSGLPWMVSQDAKTRFCRVEQTPKKSYPGKVLGYYKTERDASQALEKFKRSGTCASDAQPN
jgi:hypothetical protein